MRLPGTGGRSAAILLNDYLGDGMKAGKPSFWRSQVAFPGSVAQRVVDGIFGLAVPLFCLFLDPGVFKTPSGSTFSAGLLEHWRVYGYCEIALGVIVLGYFLACQRGSNLVVGVLIAGASFAAGVGLLLLPFSLLLLAMPHWSCVMGLLPFLTALVFVRNACRSWLALGANKGSGASVVTVFMLTFFLAAIPDLVVLAMVPPAPPGL